MSYRIDVLEPNTKPTAIKPFCPSLTWWVGSHQAPVQVCKRSTSNTHYINNIYCEINQSKEGFIRHCQKILNDSIFYLTLKNHFNFTISRTVYCGLHFFILSPEMSSFHLSSSILLFVAAVRRHQSVKTQLYYLDLLLKQPLVNQKMKVTHLII